MGADKVNHLKKENILKVVCEHVERVLPASWSQKIEDYRVSKSKVWNLSYVLEVLMAAALSGCKTLREIETYSEMYAERIPDTTLHDIMIKLDASSLKQELAKGVKQALREHELDKGEFPLRITVVDGKALYTTDRVINEFSQPIGGGGNNEMFQHMMLRAMHVSSATKLYLGQRAIPNKGAETVELEPFVDELLENYGQTELLEVISVDAGMVSKRNAAILREKGLHYIMALKGSQQMLYEYAQACFAQQQVPVEVKDEIYNGKDVTRSLYRFAISEPIAGWEHATEIWKIVAVSKDLKTGKVVEETRYFITSINLLKLTNKQVLEAIRMHWGIENNANWITDVLWSEDTAPWVSKAMELVAYLRMMAYNIISRLKTRRLRAEIHRRTAWKDFFKYFEHALCRMRIMMETNLTAVPVFLV